MVRKGEVGPSDNMRSGTVGYHIFDDIGCFGMDFAVVPGNKANDGRPKTPSMLPPKVVVYYSWHDDEIGGVLMTSRANRRKLFCTASNLTNDDCLPPA